MPIFFKKTCALVVYENRVYERMRIPGYMYEEGGSARNFRGIDESQPFLKVRARGRDFDPAATHDLSDLMAGSMAGSTQ